MRVQSVSSTCVTRGLQFHQREQAVNRGFVRGQPREDAAEAQSLVPRKPIQAASRSLTRIIRER